MAWQKNKVILLSVEELKQADGTIKKVVHRYIVRKSKGKPGREQKKLELKKYNPILKKHTTYKQVKYS